jgi:mono/diheme cytochrome c family protein
MNQRTRTPKLVAALLFSGALAWLNFGAERGIAAAGPSARPQTVQPGPNRNQQPGARQPSQTSEEPIVINPSGYRPKPKSRASEQGRTLYAKRDCAACHAIANGGGRNGPPLDGIGGRRSETFLTGQLTDPATFAREHPEMHGWEPSWMPHPHASPREVKLLIAYLLTLPEPAGGFLVERHPDAGSHEAARTPDASRPLAPQPDAGRQGRRLYYTVGCASCHAIGRFGGSFGPRLDGIGDRRSRAFIVAHITNPRIHAPGRPHEQTLGPLMPRLEVTQEQVDAIADFLLTLPDAGDADAP